MRRFLIAAACVLALITGCSTPEHKPVVYRPVPMSADKAKPLLSEARESDSPEPPTSGLPVIGSETEEVPGDDTDAAAGAGDSSITIQPDCLVQVSIEEDASLDGSYPVNKLGAIELGYVGPVILYNKTEKQAAAKIRDVLKNRHFKNATVKVRIMRASYDKVKVDGAVNQPGLVPIGAGDSISLNDALLRAGGLRPSARGARVRIVRGGLLSALASTLEGEEFTLVTEDGQPSIPDVTLRNNDVAYVFSSEVAAGAGGEREVLVLGEVRKPGVYRFSANEPCTLMHLIFKMGDFPPYANTKAIRVVRRDRDGNETEMTIDARRILKDGDPAMDTTLENGDRVIVPARRLSIF